MYLIQIGLIKEINMWAWILSAMELTAKLALGGIFWLIALAIVGVVLGLIGAGIAKAMDR